MRLPDRERRSPTGARAAGNALGSRLPDFCVVQALTALLIDEMKHKVLMANSEGLVCG
ncbi:MAG: hypothetical protein HQL91_00570 [Magnetococcales bacterium]|nr:hypothetical protein [Magnetococcales bacterium]